MNSSRQFIAGKLVTRNESPAERLRRLPPCVREVAELVALGWHVKRIATARGVSPNTVRNQRSQALALLGVGTSVELTRFWMEHAEGWQPPALPEDEVESAEP